MEHLPPALVRLARQQDYVLSREQAMAAGMSARMIGRRIAQHGWQRLLPGVLLVHPGEPTRRQLLIAARQWAGDDSAIDGIDACRFYGVRGVFTDDGRVRVAVPATSPARTRDFVEVRRSVVPLKVVRTGRLVYVDASTAAVVAARRMSPPRAAALLSEMLQRHIAGYEDLLQAHLVAPPRGAAHMRVLLDHLEAGARSSAEVDFRRLVLRSDLLPEPLWNCLLELPDGTCVSPDALWAEAAIVHEPNGQRYHLWGLDFEQMQRRHDRMTVAGLTVMHNMPRRLRVDGDAAIAEVEATYRRQAGSGLPPGVRLLRRSAA